MQVAVWAVHQSWVHLLNKTCLGNYYQVTSLLYCVCITALDGNCLRLFKSGIYHAVPRGETNWHQLACLTVQTTLDNGQLLQLDPNAIIPIPSSEYPLPAPRPMNSRLSSKKLEIELESLGLVSKLPHWNKPWDEQVSNYVKHLLKV